MPSFGRKSAGNLATCHADLMRLCNDLIKRYDFSIAYGHRGKAEQDKAFAEKKSKLRYPNSKHNSMPSMAVDIVPWAGKELWGNTNAELLQIGRIIGAAEETARRLGIKIRCGIDWNSDGQATDEKFMDAFHIELVGE